MRKHNSPVTKNHNKMIILRDDYQPEVSRQNSHPILGLHHTLGNHELSRLLASGTIQAKLEIGQPNDIYEQEAERVADMVMRMPAGETENMVAPVAGTILNRKATSSNINSAPSHIESSITNAAGSGAPLPADTRDFFESRFGHDFSGVRVHADSRADKLNEDLSARAFTVGNDIFMRQGEYNNGGAGRRLLAHELAHVVQQQSAGILHRLSGTGRICENHIPAEISTLSGGGRRKAIQCYNRDVHYNLTKQIAIAIFGNNSREAGIIAAEDQGMDDGWSHPTITSLTGLTRTNIDDIIAGNHDEIDEILAGRSLLMIREDQVIHFPSRAQAEAELTAAYNAMNLSAFGRAMHRYQDSYSHSFPQRAGTGYNNMDFAQYETWYERPLAGALHAANIQSLYPDTSHGQGAIIRHVLLGHYPDNFGRGSAQAQRDSDMVEGTRIWLQRLYERILENRQGNTI